MAWNTRPSGRRYYYRKHKHADGSVSSEYVGDAYMGQMIAILDQQEREQREAQRVAERATYEQQDAIAKEISYVGDLIRALTGATLLLTGHRQHKRQWRKQRSERGDSQ